MELYQGNGHNQPREVCWGGTGTLLTHWHQQLRSVCFYPAGALVLHQPLTLRTCSLLLNQLFRFGTWWEAQGEVTGDGASCPGSFLTLQGEAPSPFPQPHIPQAYHTYLLGPSNRQPSRKYIFILQSQQFLARLEVKSAHQKVKCVLYFGLLRRSRTLGLKEREKKKEYDLLPLDCSSNRTTVPARLSSVKQKICKN